MDLTTDWEYVADGVMGGLSRGEMRRETWQGRAATVLSGDVSLENNGGFVQIATNLRSDGAAFDASGWSGLEIELCGNGERYDIRLRTDQLTRPWQSFRREVTATREWRSLRLPFDSFESHKTDTTFDPAQLRRIGVLAIGRVVRADVAVARMALYRA